MSDAFTPLSSAPARRRIDPLPLVYAALLLTLCALLVWRPLYPSLDFWAHAAVGRWICQNGRLPDHGLFLWTASEPWVAHSWLTQVVFYGMTRLGSETVSPYVVLVLTVVLVALPFALAWLLWARHSRPSSWLLLPFALGMEACYLRLQTRPEMFTAVFLSLLLVFLVGWSGPGPLRRRDLLKALGILALVVLWANFHGAVVLGLLLLGLTAVCDLVQDRASPRSRVLALVALLAPLAVCVNPYGPAYWKALRPVAGFTFANIREWTPLWRLNPFPEEAVTALGLILALAVAAWASKPRRRWSHLAWLAAMAGLFVGAQRNVWPLTVTGLTVLAADGAALAPGRLWARLGGRSGPGGEPAPPPAVARWVVRVGLVAWLLMQIKLRTDALQDSQVVRPEHLDAGVLRFLDEHHLTGRLFNDYENSSYLQWRLAGDPPLFIDLLNAYPDRVARDYLEIRDVTPRGRELLDERGIDLVVLTVARPGPSLGPLANHLDQDRHWRRVYAETDGVVWVRRSPRYRHLWDDRDRRVLATRFETLELYHKADDP
jgi:hypothetical protein